MATTKDKNNFLRGDIFHIFLPTSDMTPEHTPPDPDNQLNGKHMCICLTDCTDTNVPANLVGIVPISKASGAVKADKLTATHMEMPKSTYGFLKVDSFALVFQSRPVGRHWLQYHNYVGNILDHDLDAMKKIALLSLLVNGGYKDIMEFAEEKLRQSIFSDIGTTNN